MTVWVIDVLPLTRCEVWLRAYSVASLFGAIFCEGIAIEVEIAHSVDGELRKGTGFVDLLVELYIC
jgi:hypothetical protein